MKRLPGIPTAAQVGGGAASRAPIDDVFQFCKVASSSIASDASAATLYNMVGIGSFEIDILDNGQGATITIATTDEESEQMQGAEVFTALGILGRPLPPDTRNGRDEHMEVLCIRETDGLVPIAARDIRLKMGGVAPGEGVLAFVGYGGGFHSLTPVEAGSTPDGGGTIHVLYAPYDFDSDGVAQKAHSIILDPTPGNESIIIAHADGSAVTIDSNGMVLKGPGDSASYIGLNEQGITLSAPEGQVITLSGSVVIGNPLLALPLLAGAASPPCSTLLVSP